MKALTIITTLACTTLLMVSCKKDNPQDPTTDKYGLNTFFSTNCENNTQHFSVDANAGGVIVGIKGTRVYINPNSLLNVNNQLVSGNVDIALIEIYDRATMVLLNKPTMGKLANGDLSTLLSGGEYYLKITQNGQELHTTSGVWVSVPTDNMGGAQAGMSVFDGFIAEDGDLEWELVEDTVAVAQDTMGGSSYEILDGQWGWTNVDRFYSDPRPKTVLKAKLPAGFDQTNSEVYITYDGETTALASLDTYTADGFFSEHYGLIPIGLEVHFIAVTLIDGELNYAIQAATITDGHIQYINAFTPITQGALAILINDLP